ncbi:hypothetical protein IEU95_08015 [Hoyosella rhizosphaerae]|uniref:Uncharacterized protein n=1 Tax=Hoyosella rhizosphaerae TaxID=1755582 RepID=A0A916X9C5_9ACTN|nr:hypothetical protein [Hoyosella rhizosphaerae]MBN4926772.1 hypothetical protein [Hoyosella rhizosphaerae]GGC56613.1 hypothetical protein GCM10011410_06330 [Hoyosella rhizosphaerae]
MAGRNTPDRAVRGAVPRRSHTADQVRRSYRDTAKRPTKRSAKRPHNAEAARALAERRRKARRGALRLEIPSVGSTHVSAAGFSMLLIVLVCGWVVLLSNPFGGAVLGPSMPSTAFIVIAALGLYALKLIED